MKIVEVSPPFLQRTLEPRFSRSAIVVSKVIETFSSLLGYDPALPTAFPTLGVHPDGDTRLPSSQTASAQLQ